MAEHSVHRKLPAWMEDLDATTSTIRRGDSDSKSDSLTDITSNVPLLRFKGTINYCSTVGECGAICEELMSQAVSEDKLMLGFDMEWPVDFKTGSGKTALIQICVNEKICHLFHVCCMRNLPVAFIHLLQHPKVKLIGVNIKNDLWKLSRDFGVTVKPLIESRVVELRDFANEVLHCDQNWSLDRLVLHVLKMKLDKSDTVRKSDWNTQILSSAQENYAATDAYASLLLYKHLTKKTTEDVRR
ncbi:3'-5' exonuclease isoform X2 [Periplaneta americana]|uniref:3'-5' exonuclease isoform X2 n=1 Tax=Periplaneta americana TaxID=6978 RepID=UPI0037E75CFD